MTVKMKVLVVCAMALAGSGRAAADGGGTTVPGGQPPTPTASTPATTTTIASSGGPVPTTVAGGGPTPTTTTVVRVEVPEVTGGSPVVVPVRDCAGAVVRVTLNGLPGGPLRGPLLTVPSSGWTTQTFTDVPAGRYTVSIEVIDPGVCAPNTTVAQGSQGPVTTVAQGSQGSVTTVVGGTGGTTPKVDAGGPVVTVPAALPIDLPADSSGPLPYTGTRISEIVQAALLFVLGGHVILSGSRAKRRPSPRFKA